MDVLSTPLQSPMKSENENATHHPNVGTSSAMSRPRVVMVPAPSQDTTVVAEHSAMVVIKFTNLRDFNQNKRSKSQYAEAPKAEPPARTRNSLTD